MNSIKTDYKQKTPKPHRRFQEDDKVCINVNQITSRKLYAGMYQEYQKFVESSVGIVFTAHIEGRHLVSLKEMPKWLFWDDDLILAM